MQALILTVIIPAIAMIFAAVFAGLWWQDRSRTHVAAFAYCYAALGAGVMINIFIFDAVTPGGIVAYHLLSMSGLIALIWGSAHRLGMKVPLPAYSASVILTCGILWTATAAGEREAMGLAQNFNSSLLMVLAAQNLWHAGSRQMADRALIWILVLFSCFGFIRPLLTLFSDALFGPGEEGAALLLAIHVLVLAIFLTLQAVALIAAVLGDKEQADRELAAIDPLSKLPMRARFESEAHDIHARAQEKGVAISLIIADIDHFKRVNDTHGHAAGDRVIAAFGELISGALRPNDLCGRIGGEEFCIIAYNCDGPSAQALADRLRQQTNRLMVPWSTQELRVSASFGVAPWESHEPYADVFKRADTALYAAKHAGRDQVILSGLEERGEASHVSAQPANSDSADRNRASSEAADRWMAAGGG